MTIMIGDWFSITSNSRFSEQTENHYFVFNIFIIRWFISDIFLQQLTHMNIGEITWTEKARGATIVNSIIYLEFLQKLTELPQSFYRKLASTPISDCPMPAASSERMESPLCIWKFCIWMNPFSFQFYWLKFSYFRPILDTNTTLPFPIAEIQFLI